MRSLSLRKLEDETYARLRVRAARHGVSMEEEARRIIQRAVMAPDRLGDLAVQYFGAQGVKLRLPRRKPHKPLELDV